MVILSSIISHNFVTYNYKWIVSLVFLFSVHASKKTLKVLFGDLFCTVDPSQIIKTSRDLAHAEIVKYRETAILSFGGNLLDWWQSHQTEFTLLWDLYKRYLCIPGTRVPSKWAFSTLGDTVCSEHSVLSPEHVDQFFLFYREKFWGKENTRIMGSKNRIVSCHDKMYDLQP